MRLAFNRQTWMAVYRLRTLAAKSTDQVGILCQPLYIKLEDLMLWTPK